MSAASIKDDRSQARHSSCERRSSRLGNPSRKFTRPLSCKQEVSFIDGYLATSLDPQLSQAFDEHLKDCPDCVAFLATYRKTIEITGAFLQLQSLKQRRRRLTLRTPSKSTARR